MAKEPRCHFLYESIDKCYAYFYRIFNDIRYDLYLYKDGDIKTKYNIYKINEINDPILKHIAIYLIENYNEAQNYFSKDGKWQNNYACDLLNKWLDNKKSYFTHALHCKGNVHLWNKTIEPLWKKLESHYKNNGKNESKKGSVNKWCERNKYFRGNLQLPNDLNRPLCYKHVPKEYECVLPFPPTMINLKNTCDKDNVKKYYNKCKTAIKTIDASDFSSLLDKAIANGNSLFKSIDDITFSRQVQKNIVCPSLKYAIPISVCLSFFGTLLIIFLLKQFTPLGSKLSYRGLNKKRLRDNFKEELEYEEYARSMNKNPQRGHRRNNIYYHSVRN